MRNFVGVVILLIGVYSIGYAISDIPLGAGAMYLLGYFIPSGGIFILGVVILVWGKKKKVE